MKPRKPISPVSKARRILLAQYERVKKRWRQQPENFRCAFLGCKREADKSPHHCIPRSVRPDLLCEPANLIPICRGHHDWIGLHPQEAYNLGLLGHSWENLGDIAARRVRMNCNLTARKQNKMKETP